MNYDRNRTRIAQLTDAGATRTPTGFYINGNFIPNYNIEFMNDEAWEVFIQNSVRTQEQIFWAYIDRLKSVTPPRLQDERLSEMVGIIDNVITEYFKYVDEELKKVNV